MQCSRLIAIVLALISWTWIATAPAGSQSGEARVSLVMSKLPPQNSAAYRAIRKHAGDVTVELLTLTKTEVWSLSADKADAVKAAANRYGVGVEGLPPDWNHVFRPMPAHSDMSEAHRNMAAQAESKATMGVGRMLPPRAAVMEYALTRGVEAQTPPADPPKIVLRLNDATALTLVRTSVDIRADMCVWRGTVEGTGAPATILWWPGVTMAGTVRHEGRLYSIRRMRGGVHAMAVVEMSEDRMPPEHAPMPERMRSRDPSLRDDPLVRQGDAGLLRFFGRPDRSTAQPKASTADTKQPAAGPNKAGNSPDTVINVIVAHTAKAAQKYSDVRRELAELSIEEANQSFHNSNLGHIKLQLVHTYQTDYVEDGEHFDHLWRFADKGDGYMDEIHALRARYDADLAILVVDDAKGCGLATRVYADADEGFAVVHHECAATTYSVAHEIGHLIGARHELEIDKIMTPFPYGHGYVNGTKWRDIMSYKESCGGCRRLPIWSSPKLLIEGEPAGTANEDNARVIAEQAGRVASFRPSRFKRSHWQIAVPSPSSASTADQPAERK